MQTGVSGPASPMVKSEPACCVGATCTHSFSFFPSSLEELSRQRPRVRVAICLTTNQGAPAALKRSATVMLGETSREFFPAPSANSISAGGGRDIVPLFVPPLGQTWWYTVTLPCVRRFLLSRWWWHKIDSIAFCSTFASPQLLTGGL